MFIYFRITHNESFKNSDVTCRFLTLIVINNWFHQFKILKNSIQGPWTTFIFIYTLTDHINLNESCPMILFRVFTIILFAVFDKLGFLQGC